MAPREEAQYYKGALISAQDDSGRLRRQHLLQRTAMDGKLIRVPLPSDVPVRILDAGTSDGFWMLDIASEYPYATLVGTDINPKHFDAIPNLPESISFKQQNLLGAWPAEDLAAYDLVHQRYCLAQFTAEQDAEIVRNLWSIIKPGGFIQLHEANMQSFERGDNHKGMKMFMEFCAKAFPQANMNQSPGPMLKQLLEQAGATEVNEEVISFPMGRAAESEEMRRVTTENMEQIITMFTAFCAQIPNYWYSPEDFHALKKAVLEEMDGAGNTWKFWVVTARKPE